MLQLKIAISRKDSRKAVAMTDQDIVGRLQSAHENSNQRIVGSNIFAEAADTIERLTAELAECRAREQKLVKALQKIADLPELEFQKRPLKKSPQQIARAALSDGGGK